LTTLSCLSLSSGCSQPMAAAEISRRRASQ
jgi:hypothetical protein